MPTLSGGEAQRLKLAGHLVENRGQTTISSKEVGDRPAISGKSWSVPNKLFLFDEPTTGLHFDDIAKLLRALRKLIATGHSVVVIEHNLDVIRAADWIIDLGPEGGDAGGEIVCAGTPAEVRAHGASHTGKALRDYALALGHRPESRSSCAFPRHCLCSKRVLAPDASIRSITRASTICRTSTSTSRATSSP